MIRFGAVLMAGLAVATFAKADDALYTGSKDIVVDLSVLGAEEEIKLGTDRDILPAEEVSLIEPVATKKNEKVVLKKPPFTYKKMEVMKVKDKAVKKAEPVKPVKIKPTKAAAKAVTVPVAKPEPVAVQPESVAQKSVPVAKPAPVAKAKPEAKAKAKAEPAPVPKSAPVTAVEKEDISDIIATSGHVVFFDFAPNATGLTAADNASLKKVAEAVKKDDTLAIRLIAYAKNPEIASSKARRTALARGLVIRDFLMSEGIESGKIEVRALGNRVQKDQVFLEIIAE